MCANALIVPIEVVDQAVLQVIAGDLRPRVVKAIIAEVYKQLAPASVASELNGLRAV